MKFTHNQFGFWNQFWNLSQSVSERLIYKYFFESNLIFTLIHHSMNFFRYLCDVSREAHLFLYNGVVCVTIDLRNLILPKRKIYLREFVATCKRIPEICVFGEPISLFHISWIKRQKWDTQPIKLTIWRLV